MNIRRVLQCNRFKAHGNTKRTVNDLLKFLLLVAKQTNNVAPYNCPMIFYCFALLFLLCVI